MGCNSIQYVIVKMWYGVYGLANMKISIVSILGGGGGGAQKPCPIL
jgi:hypothetical protein